MANSYRNAPLTPCSQLPAHYAICRNADGRQQGPDIVNWSFRSAAVPMSSAIESTI